MPPIGATGFPLARHCSRDSSCGSAALERDDIPLLSKAASQVNRPISIDEPGNDADHVSQFTPSGGAWAILLSVVIVVSKKGDLRAR
jgi:hypothetical protein